MTAFIFRIASRFALCAAFGWVVGGLQLMQTITLLVIFLAYGLTHVL